MATDNIKREVAHDESPAIISDHQFQPVEAKNEDLYWQKCRICNLAMAAHLESSVPNEPKAKPAKPETIKDIRTEEDGSVTRMASGSPESVVSSNGRSG